MNEEKVHEEKVHEEKVHVAEDAVSLYENLSIEEVWGCFRLEPSQWYRWPTISAVWC
jgi:hypothetical protein